MRKQTDSSNARWARGVMLGIILAGCTMPVVARAGAAFTWDPAGASPSLAGAGSAFAADGIVGLHYLYDVTPPTGSPALYPVDFIEQITGFTLDGGTPFSPPGLNGPAGAPGSYGLYLSMQAVVQQSGATRIYRSLTMSLMVDPGNNDGAVSSTLANGLAFTNSGPTGTADDITLATGSLISGKFTQNPAPGISVLSDFTESFTPAPGEIGFFVSPVSPYAELEELLTTPVANLQLVLQPDGSTVALLNGGGATMDLLVPEPSSLLLFGGGLVSLAAVCRPARNRRPRQLSRPSTRSHRLGSPPNLTQGGFLSPSVGAGRRWQLEATVIVGPLQMTGMGPGRVKTQRRDIVAVQRFGMADRQQIVLLPPCLDDYVMENNPVRVIQAFVDELDLAT